MLCKRRWEDILREGLVSDCCTAYICKGGVADDKIIFGFSCKRMFYLQLVSYQWFVLPRSGDICTTLSYCVGVSVLIVWLCHHDTQYIALKLELYLYY